MSLLEKTLRAQGRIGKTAAVTPARRQGAATTRCPATSHRPAATRRGGGSASPAAAGIFREFRYFVGALFVLAVVFVVVFGRDDRCSLRGLLGAGSGEPNLGISFGSREAPAPAPLTARILQDDAAPALAAPRLATLSIVAPAEAPVPAADWGAAAEAPVPAAPAAPAATVAAGAWHRVGEGETLASLARRYYGSPGEWPRILEANRGRCASPEALAVGTTLLIPDVAAGGATEAHAAPVAAVERPVERRPRAAERREPRRRRAVEEESGAEEAQIRFVPIDGGYFFPGARGRDL